LDAVRKDIGRGFGRVGVFKDDDSGLLNQAYKVISEDQQGMADAFGVGSQYAAARKLISQRKEVEEQSVTLFGGEMQGSLVPKLRTAATNLTKGDVSNFNKLLNAIPKARRNEATGFLLNEIFTLGARRESGITPSFVDAFENLNRNPSIKNRLFNELPDGVEDRFNAVGNLSRQMFKTISTANTSRTAAAADVLKIANEHTNRMLKIFSKGAGIAGRLKGIPGIETGVNVLISRRTTLMDATDELFTSSKFKEMALNSSKVSKGTNTPQDRLNIKEARMAAGELTRTTVFKGWLRALPASQSDEILRIGFYDWYTKDDTNDSQKQSSENLQSNPISEQDINNSRQQGYTR
jgi:hypothetical protein